MDIDLNKLFSKNTQEVLLSLEQLEQETNALYEEQEYFDYDTDAVTLRHYQAKSKAISGLLLTAKQYHGCPAGIELSEYLTTDFD